MAAIYQWYWEEAIIFTTKLYPVEEVESLDIAADLTSLSTLGVPVDLADWGPYAVISAELELIKINADAWYDEADWGPKDVISAELEVIKIYADAWYDEADWGPHDFISAELEFAKIEHIQPNEDKLNISSDILSLSR